MQSHIAAILLFHAGKELNLAGNVFKLGHLVDASLLRRRDAIEDLSTSALKEEAIESKLDVIAMEWGEYMVNFQEYKTRGPIMLKVSIPSPIQSYKFTFYLVIPKLHVIFFGESIKLHVHAS